MKLKDNIDLKELEKFGFTQCFDLENLRKCISREQIINYNKIIYIKVDIQTREFEKYIYNPCIFSYLNKVKKKRATKKDIEDLINAGLVEEGE